jgi:hypothetical protein
MRFTVRGLKGGAIAGIRLRLIRSGHVIATVSTSHTSVHNGSNQVAIRLAHAIRGRVQVRVDVHLLTTQARAVPTGASTTASGRWQLTAG